MINPTMMEAIMGANGWNEKEPLLHVHPLVRAAVVLITTTSIIVGAAIQLRYMTVGF